MAGGKTGRKPADVVGRAPKPEGRPAVWAAIRRMGNFVARDVVHATDVPYRTVVGYLHALVAGGYVRDLGPPGGVKLYRLVLDVGAEAPRVRRDGTTVTMGRAQENMWRTMRLNTTFTALELAAWSSTEETTVSLVAAKHYCGYLFAAGYLLAAGVGDRRTYTFIPARYTGPQPPQIQRLKQVWDPNVGRVMWSSKQAREAGRGE